MPYLGNWANIPLGKMGLVTDLPSSEIPHEALIDSQNVDYAPGFLQKAPGSFRYNTSPLPAGIVGVHDFWLDFIRQRMFVATADGQIWKDYGDRQFSGHVPITTGLGALYNSCQFITAGQEVAGNPKKTFFFSGGLNQVRVIEGDNNFSTLIAEPSPDWKNPNISGDNINSNFPKFGIIHRSRLWVFAKGIAYASNTTNHEDFQTLNSTLTLNVGPGEGGDITGAFVYKNTLFVFKQGDFVYRLVDTDASSANWYFSKLAEGFGIAGSHAAAQCNDSLIVGNVQGTLTQYDATFYLSNFSQADIFKRMKVTQFYKQHTSPAGIPFMHALYYADRALGLFTTRQAYLTHNDSATVYSLSDPAMPKWGFWTHYQADCWTFRRDVNNVLRPIYGAADGYVYTADWPTRSVQGVGYVARFQTPHLDFRHLDPSLIQKNKEFERLAITFTPTGNHTLNFDIYLDGKYAYTTNCTLTVNGNYLDNMVLDQDVLGTQEEQTVEIDLRGSGRRISIAVYDSGNPGENFQLSQLGIGFRITGEDATITG